MKKLFSILILSTIAILFLAINPSANFVYAQESQSRTVFLVSSQFVANTKNGVYIYDSSDVSLKKLSATPSESERYAIQSCKDMCSLDNNIYMLNSSDVTIFDTSTNTSVSVNVDGLSDYHAKVSVSLVGSQSVICVYPTNTQNNETILYGLPSENGYEFSSISFAAHETEQGTNISLIKFIEYNSTVYALRIYDQSITCYPISQLGGELSLNTVTSLKFNDSGSNQIVSIDCVYMQNNPYICASYANKTEIYSFGGDKIDLVAAVSHIYDQVVFDCIDMSANKTTIALLSENCYYIVNIDTNEATISSKLANPECIIEYRDCKDYAYYTTTQPSQIISSLGTTAMTQLDAGCHVVEIADVKLSDGSDLVGYKYVMYAKFDSSENLFGYMITDNNCLSQNDQTLQNKTVKVYENSKLYQFPSTIVDSQEGNQVIDNISSNLPVEILNYINVYQHSYNGTTISYALVSVNGNIGFIDTKAIVSEDKRVILVIPNAEIMHDTNIYELASTKSNILHRLEAGTKVKIINNRDSNGYVLVAYNDDDGNYFEGYLKYENIKTDGYSTLQIIGLVLVLLNCVFLIVLLICKKRIVK